METHIICFANSLKEGGRCIAGIELNTQGYPVFIQGRPKWVRPVCHTEHGEIPEWMAVPYNLLDILILDVLENKPEGYQSENVTFTQNSIRSGGTFDQADLLPLCDTKEMIFGNKGKAVSEEAIENLDHSLMLIRAEQFEAVKKVNELRSGKSQLRMKFTYCGEEYNLPITDPVFRDRYSENPKILMDRACVYLCVSLGIQWEGWHYKLVAGVIY
jgi:hypothetical protein